MSWGRAPGALPDQCDAVLDLEAPTPSGELIGHFTSGETSRQQLDVVAESLDLDAAERLARALAPLRPYRSTATGELPPLVELVDVLGLGMRQPEEAAGWWLQGATEAGLRAPLGLGIGPDGRPCSLELDLERDGPHGLVAGTTGSGKSEWLVSFILGLACRFSPHRVGFVLIDYKGGAAFGPIVDLPHTLGLVTDLDEQLAQRSLVALRAELESLL